MNKRDFIKNAAALSTFVLLPSGLWSCKKEEKKLTRLRTAHIGVGNMGAEDLKAISSHAKVDVTVLCDVDANNLAAAKELHPNAKTYTDYRVMLKEMGDEIDAVVVSTPDHTHAPASMMAMEMDKPVYCQKPLTHYVSEARAMNIGKVHTVRAWSPKDWGYDGTEPTGSDPIPESLDWNLWLGTSAERPFKEGFYHPGNWRKLVDYGCGTLGDMGVHIFDTPYNALNLQVPKTIKNECREPNGFGFPQKNVVTYEFPQTEYTAETLKWVWYDGPGAPEDHEDLILPGAKSTTSTEDTSKESMEDKMSLDTKEAGEGTLPDQGAMFIGEKGRLLLPHFMQLPKKIVDGEYVDISAEIEAVEKANNMGKPIRNYDTEGPKHYHQFVDACLGTDKTTAPFSYASRLTETILLGVIAGRFPNQVLHWDSENAKFAEEEANAFLEGDYRNF